MSFQTPITIAEAVHKITENSYLLPAIQREFVWSHDKIEWLFDSIMRSYPIGSFLFWEIEGNTTREYKFYKCIQEFRGRYKTHNEEISTNGLSSFTAILDGQQRLTALYIGLKGSYAYKEHKKRWEDTERSIPTRRLYLNIDKTLVGEEDGRIYDFKFLTDSDTKDQKIYQNSNNIQWFKVGEILNFANDEDLDRDIESLSDFSKQTIRRLRRSIVENKLINFFLLKDVDIDTALNIFIRINGGGEPLDFSDLIMSNVIANWTKTNARKEIHQLVDNIQDKGFTIKKDLVLRTYLYLYSNDIRFKVNNFSKELAQSFEQVWDKIRDCLLSTFDLIKTFGFNDDTLTSKNSILPIVYYLYHKSIYENYSTKIEYEQDRLNIKKWLHISLLKRVFGRSSSNTILSQIRHAFTADLTNTKITSNMDGFPSEKIFSHIEKNVSVGEEFIAELLTLQYKDNLAFSLLSMLFLHLDYRNNSFHIDYLHPEKQFKEISKDKYNKEDCNSIVNLQVLDANENRSKKDLPLDQWIHQETVKKSRDRTAFLEAHLLPTDMTDFSIHNFDEFYTKRKILLTEKLTELLK